MFKENDKGMRQDITPERVLSGARLINMKPMSRETFFKYVRLGKEGSHNSNYAKYNLDALLDLALIENKDGIYEFIGDDTILNSITSFRRYVSKFVGNKRESSFFKATEFMINNGAELMISNNQEKVVALLKQNGLSEFNENAVGMWSAWLDFMGYSVKIIGNPVMPNMAVRIMDAAAEIKMKRKMTAAEFRRWITESIPETAQAINKDAVTLPLAISNGIRTLRNMKKVELESMKDAARIKLYPLPGLAIEEFSSITLAKEV